MFDRDDVDLALEAVKEGWSMKDAGELVGASASTVSKWARGRVPHERAAGARARLRTAGREEKLNASEREEYEAAMVENMLFRAVLADLKAGEFLPQSMSNRRKCELGERLREERGWPLRAIIDCLKISKSSYEYHRARLGRDKYARLRAEIVSISEETGHSRGYRPIWAELRRRGVTVSEKVVRRIMREEGLTPAYLRKHRKWSSYKGETSPAPPNLPLRADGTHDFSAPAPNLLWVTDITEFKLPGGGKVYLSAVIDCFDGRPAAWSAGEHPTAELANSSLAAACATLGPGEAPVVHSDRGCHYRWLGWEALCGQYGLTRSMSRKGTSPDNARAEGFFGLVKNEFFRCRRWSGVGAREFIAELDAWLEWYRSGRIKCSLGWMTMDEHREALGYAV